MHVAICRCGVTVTRFDYYTDRALEGRCLRRTLGGHGFSLSCFKHCIHASLHPAALNDIIHRPHQALAPPLIWRSILHHSLTMHPLTAPSVSLSTPVVLPLAIPNDSTDSSPPLEPIAYSDERPFVILDGEINCIWLMSSTSRWRESTSGRLMERNLVSLRRYIRVEVLVVGLSLMSVKCYSRYVLKKSYTSCELLRKVLQP